MFVGIDGFSTLLVAPAPQGTQLLTVADGSAVCSLVDSGDFTVLVISDGTHQENVQVIGCTGSGQLRLNAPTEYAYPAGACVRFTVTAEVVCQLIAQGGCASIAPPPTAACTPVQIIAGRSLPQIPIGVPFEHAIVWSGTSPFSVTALVKPSWMTVSPTGITSATAAIISGTAPDDTERYFQLLIEGCNSTRVEMIQTLCYCQQAGA